MDKKLFADLMDSIKQAGSIIRGETPPSRSFVVDEQEVEAEKGAPPKSIERFIGVLADSAALEGDPVEIQKKWRDEW